MSDPPEEHQGNGAASLHSWPVRRGVRIALAVALGLILLRFATQQGAFIWFAIMCPYEIEYGEGILLHYALMIARGHPFYNNYHHYPYLVATYPPMYPLLCALGVKVLGVSFAFGRVLSVLSTAGVAALIWVMLRRARASRFAAGFATALFLAAPVVCCWGAVMRVDMVAVFLGMAGLYCVTRGGRWLIPAVLLLTLAVFTRQSQVAPLAAAGAYLWWSHRRKDAVLVVASWGMLTLATFVTLQSLSHGWFYRHVITANTNAWELQGFLRIWVVTLPWAMPFLLGLVGVGFVLLAPAGQGHGAEDRRRAEGMLLWYFGFAMLLSLTAGKVGASVNYMLEPVAAASLMAGVGYQRLAERLRFRVCQPVWVAAWLLMVGSPALMLAKPGRVPYGAWRDSPQLTDRASRTMVPLIRRTKGDILSENTGLLLITHHPILLDPHKMTSMSHDGTWDQRPLLRDIRRRRFSLIITTWNPAMATLDRRGTYGDYRWTKEMGEAIRRNYHLVQAAPNLYALAPGDETHPSFERLRLGLPTGGRSHQNPASLPAP